MSGITIRAPREEEFPAIYGLACAAFGAQPDQEDEAAHRLGFPFDRAFCAYEEGRMIATAAVYSQELTVPGGVAVPMGGVTWIATLPTHRRQGLMRRLMNVVFADMVERDEPLTGLGASEGNIYSRFGYGLATSVANFTIDFSRADLAVPASSRDRGRLSLLSPEEAATLLPAVYESLRLEQAGSVTRPPHWWDGYLADPRSEREGASRMLHVTHETVPGVPDGYVSYGVKEAWNASLAGSVVRVVELLAGDPGVYAALWEYVLGTDLCQSAICPRGRVDEPLRWLLADPRQFRVEALNDFLWLRLLDPCQALAARGYRSEDQLVLEVSHGFPEPGHTRLLLKADPADDARGAECSATTRDPDLALDSGSLAAAYLGGVAFATLAAAGRVRELKPGALRRADALFATDTAPYCATEF